MFYKPRRLEKRRNELDSKRNDLLAQTDDILGKREIILAYEQQDRYRRKLDKLSQQYADVERRLEISETVYRGVADLVPDAGRILILAVALFLAFFLDPSAISGIGDAYFLISIYFRIFIPASNLLSGYDALKRSEGVSKTFLELLKLGEQEGTGRPATADTTSKDTPDAIRFEKVCFRYQEDGDRWVLDGCSFSVPRNKTTLIVGRSGCGKTSIARIVLRYWLPTQGRVLIYDRDIKTWDPKDLRLKMAYVSQGDHVVDDSVRENLGWSYTKTKITDERLLQILTAVGIAEKSILDRPARDLSLGQQQRLSIARMLLDESEILILDEPLSGVDVFTIRDLKPELVRVLTAANRTVLMFSHKLSFAAHAGHVVVLGENGKVLEEGSPGDLMGRKGTFAQLIEASMAELRGE